MPQSDHTRMLPSDAHPACPACSSDVFVDALSYATSTYRCQLCAETFEADEVDR